MTTIENKMRIREIQNAPLSWKEKDLITAAEKYLTQVISFPFTQFIKPCISIAEEGLENKLAQIWRCTCAATHLYQLAQLTKEDSSSTLQTQTARIYEMENQRLLGSIFPLNNDFWNIFYLRQQDEKDKILIPLDAQFFASDRQKNIQYQLLQQCLKIIVQAHYSTALSTIDEYRTANRLIIDLPLPDFKNWINDQINAAKNY